MHKYGEFSANQWFENHNQSISPYGSGTFSENYHSFNHSLNQFATTQTMGKSLRVLLLCISKLLYSAEEHSRKERNNSQVRTRLKLLNSSLNALKNETRLRSGEKVFYTSPLLRINLFVLKLIILDKTENNYRCNELRSTDESPLH